MTTRHSSHLLARVAALGLAVLGLVAPRLAEADVSFVAAGTGAGNAGTNISISPGIPAGTALNDLLVMVVHTSANQTLTTPTGWTLMGAQVGGTTGGRATVWYLRRGATAPAAPTVRITSTTVSTAIAARIWAFRGVVTAGNPYDVVGTAYTAEAAGTTFTGDNLTTTAPYAIVLYAGGSTAANTWGPAGGTTNGGMLPNPASGTFYYSNASTTPNSVFLAYDGTPTATAGAQGAPTMAQSAATAGYSYTFTLEPSEVALGDGANPTPAATIAPGAAAQAVDAFTLATNATGTTDTVSSVTVTLAAGSSAGIETIGIYPTVDASNACTGTPLGTVGTSAAPLSTDTPTIALSGLTATFTATTYYVCVKPRSHAAMPVPPGSNYAVTGTVTAFVAATFRAVGSDATSGTVNIDNQSPTPAPSGLAGASGDGQVVLTWTSEPTDADFVTGGEVVVLRATGAAPTDKPVEGVDYAGGETLAGGAVVACVAAPGAKTCTANLLTNGTGYYFVAYARDVRLNWSGGSNAAGPVIPAIPKTIQLVTGATVSGGAICPDATGVYADQFGFTVAGAADRVSGLTVSGLGTTTPIASIKVADDTGTVIASATPTGDAQSFTFTAPNLAAPVGTTNYRIYFDVKAHAALAAGNTIVTPTVTSYISTNTQTTGSDGANSFTINNTAQANVPSAAAGSATETSLTVTYGASTGAAQYVVFARRGGAPTGPTDGTPYAAGTPDLNNTWVAYAGPSTTPPAISGLASSSTYYFAVYARDACFNYSTVAASATGTTSAPAQAITVGNGTGVVAASVAPGSTAWTPLDSFSVTITSGPTSATLQSVTYTSLAGMSQYLAGVRLVRGSDSVVLSTATAPSGDTWSFTGLTEAISTAAAQYRLEFQPKGHAAMPAASGNLVLAPGSAGLGVVTAIGTNTGATVTYSDGNAPDPATGQVVIDNQAPADPTAVAATGGSGDAHVSWANPGDLDFDKVVILAKQGSAFLASERPADGDAPALNAIYGAATVVYAGRSSPQAIGGLAAGTWYFKVLARDTSGNFSAGAPSVETSATVSSFVADGDPTPGSVKPVVAIVNPMRGAVVAVPFRLQARIFSPKTSGGVSQPITGVALLVDEVDSGLTVSPLAAYGTTTESGVWGTTVSTLATGSHTLRVTATNASGTVYSGTVTVSVVAANTGDGNMLVRDNASQLCSDCHAMKTHSSEATGNALGSWAVTCRECHTPHDTTNIELVRTKIKPPELAGSTAEQNVVFLNKTGYAAGSFASPTNNGPCQVCHTRTDYYRSTGPGPGGAHETGDCSTCHVHNKGLAASCTNCHGTESRASIAGADNRQSAAPPAVAAGSTSVTNGGAHVAHVNQATWRTNPLPCAACHPAPHATKGQTDIQWSTLATGNGAILDANMNPPAGTLGSAWPTTPSCTNWCHGGGMPAGGGSHTSPAWTEAATAAQCGTCHASPPPLGGGTGRDHPQNVACALCHGAGYAQASLDPTAKGTHVDGTIQKPNNGCNACHGKLAGPAPAVAVGSTSPLAAPGYDALSVDTQGNTYASSVPPPVGVGAHGKHVNDGMMSAKSCNVCHPLPLDGDTSHANGAVQMAWSAPANSGGITNPGYTRPTCTNYCHSSGDPMGAATATLVPGVTWTSQTSMTCSSCHPSSAIATNAHARHVGGYGYNCSACHVATTLDGSSIVVGGGAHVNGSNDVSFDASSAFVQGGSYTSPTCSNIYCHSNGTKRAPPYVSGPSVAWNSGATTCTSCHGGPVGSASQIATGKHNNHVNVSAVIGGAASTNMACGTCHKNTVAVGTNAPLISTSAHVDRVASVSFDSTYGAAATFAQGATEGTGTCSSNYCHSSGQDPAAVPAIIQYLTPAWNDAALGCDGCHGRAGGTGNGTGAPNYANGGGGTPTANSHTTAHVTSSADCEHCHAGTVTSAGTAILATSTLHLDKQREVQILAAYDTNLAASNYTQASKTCNNVSCHGSGTPQWGGPKPKCSDCHGGTTDTDSFAFGTLGVISTTEWSAVGHGQASFGANTFPTLAAGTPCLYCHDDGVLHDQTGNPFRLRGATGANGAITAGNYSATTATSANQVCLNCHAVTGSNGVDLPDGGTLGTNPLLTSTKKVDAYHAGSKHSGAANGGTRCWDCHDPHGDGTNIKMVGSKVVKASTDNHSWAATRVTGVTFTANATGTDYANATTSSLCRACHASAAHYNATTNDGHNSGSKCIACHAHQQTPNLAFQPSSGCSACHNAPPTGGKHLFHDETTFAETSYANSARHASATQYGFACNTCHNGTHMNGTGPYTAQVAFNVFDAITVGGTYAAGAAQPADTAPTGMLTFNWSNGTCSATYCHSNASPVGGTASNGAPAWNETAWVKTGASANECTKCHKMTADNTGLATSTNLSHAHYLHTATTATGGYFFSCTQCHNAVVSSGASDYPTTAGTIKDKTLHVSGTHNVAFDATVNPGTTSYAQGPSYTCANTYCHSNGTNAASPPLNTSIAWNTSVAANCSSCHGGYTGTIIATGKHTEHANNPTDLGTSYYCVDCHATTVTGTTTPAVNIAGGKHVNRTKDVSIGNRGTMPSYDTGPTCTNTYCHSNGQRGAANTRAAQVTWSDAAWPTAAPGICAKCHGTEAGSIAGEPRYANGGPDTATANSHAKHVTAGTDCATCHNGIVNAAGTAIASASHTNGVIDVVFDSTKAGNTATHADGTFTSPSTYVSGTCTSVKCHGTNTTPVKWGDTLDCSACHMGPTGTTDAEVDDYNYNNGTFAKLDPEDWINNGHGRPSGSYDSGNPAAAFDTAIGVSSDDGCKYCHDKTVLHGQFGTSANPFRLANIGAGNTAALKNGVCTVCHGGAGYLGKTATKAIDADHYGAKHTSAGTFGGQLCWDCHDPHGDSRYTTNATETPVVAANEVLGYMIDAKLVRSHPTAEGNTTEWGTNGTTGPTYATSSPRFNKALGGSTTAYDWPDYAFSTLNGVCQVCHTGTAHFLSTSWNTAVNGDSTHNNTPAPGPKCTSCHTHDQPPSDAFKASCTGCHGNKGALRTPVTGADTMLEYAPPTARDGTTSATTANGVGAHLSHVNQLTLRSAALSCSDCHGASLPAAGHPSTGQAPISFGALATTGGITTATYTQGTGCSATYCHGNFKNGNDQITPRLPGAAGAVSFSAIADNGLTVSWGAAAGAAVYKVERAPDVSGAPGTFVQIGTATGTSYTDGGLWAATPYWYRVRGWSSLGDGAYSGNASVRTTGGVIGTFTAADFDMVGEDSGTVVDGAATNISSTATTATATTTVDNRNIATVNYTYANTTQRRLRPSAAISSGTYYWVDIFSPPLTASDCVVAASATVSIDTLVSTAGTANPAYWTVTLFEYASDGTSASKGTCQASYNSTSTTLQTSTCTLNNLQWTAVVGSRLKLRIQQNPTANFGRTGLLWGATTGTTAGQTWFRASRASLTPPTPPAAPTGAPVLTMGASTQTTIAMSWTAVTGATSYDVERSPNGTSGWVQVGQAAAISFTDSALTPNTNYFYRVRASNAGGDSATYSPAQQKQTLAVVANVTAWTGTFTPGATTLTCTSCHGDPPGGTHPASTDCNLCHPGYTSSTVVKATHMNGVVDKVTDCTICHSIQLGARRPVISEFAMTWSHKRSGGGTVTNYDCIVCHMEGDPATGLPTDGGAHMNGVLNLRDPDTGANIKGVTFSVALGGTTAGAYSSTATDATPAAFSRDLSSATIEPDVAAIQVNLCLKCHDSNGATAFLLSNPNAGGAQGALYPMRAQGGTRTAEKPFGTTVSYASIPAANGGTATAPSGAYTANAVAGGVINVATSFLTTNSSYHPVSGRNNNSYANGTRMAAPWATAVPNRVAGTITNGFGYLLSCWDCHAPDGTASTATLTSTVTAHGGTTTVRGNSFASGTENTVTAPVTLCMKCHAQYDTLSSSNHSTGSAFSGSGNNNMQTALRTACNACHGGFWSATTGVVQTRPMRAEDVHGFDALPAGGNVGSRQGRWSVATGTPSTLNTKPYAFIRNTYVLGQHSPKSAVVGATTVAYSPGCTNPTAQAMTACGQMSTYTVGGVY